MSKTIEVPDIAQWEETDSELAKYTIQELNGDIMHLKTSLKYMKQEYVKMQEQVDDLQDRIDKAIEYIEENKPIVNASAVEDILRGNDE